ncbi:MAG: hypothetical protein AAGJ32_05995 [Pseudomonadota bacterium]
MSVTVAPIRAAARLWHTLHKTNLAAGHLTPNAAFKNPAAALEVDIAEEDLEAARADLIDASAAIKIDSAKTDIMGLVSNSRSAGSA